jgi:hypothetical protein
MHLAEELAQPPAEGVSYVRDAVLREDAARLTRLDEIYSQHADLDDFIKHGLYNQWTNGDFRTHEIRAEVESLLRAYHAFLAGGRSDALDEEVRGAWRVFDRARLNVLVGC